MRTVTKTETIYQFDELTEGAKNKARGWYASGGLVYEWWKFICEDAARIGLEIVGFDLGNRKGLKGHLTVSVRECCTRIMKEHGKECDTYILAANWGMNWEKFNQEMERAETEGNEEEVLRLEEELEEDQVEFQQALLEEYFVLLNKEYEYINSNESIDENIRCNGYEFYEDGTIA
jgi:hypothetical protein